MVEYTGGQILMNTRDTRAMLKRSHGCKEDVANEEEGRCLNTKR